MGAVAWKRGVKWGGMVALTLATQNLWAHGYLTSPEARGYACKLGQNTDCGAIVWEPQSLEAPKGFPQAGPADGHIASAAVARFSELDVQTANRWSKHAVQAGPNNFSWRFTARHSTQSWRYFITKPGWNPNAPLTRAAFDLTPFCTVDGNFRQPEAEVTHRCNVPSRSGYQVILAVWDIADTTNAFYNVIDVDFGGGTIDTGWTDVGDINPVVDLKPGDSVRARFFDGSGENLGLETRIDIDAADQGDRNVWPRLLAQAINAEHTDLKAGRMDAQGNIAPVSGKNDVFTLSGSGVQRVEISIEQQQTPTANLSVTGVQSSYPIQDGEAMVSFSLNAEGTFNVVSRIFDAGNRQVAQQSDHLSDASQTLRISLPNAPAGQYSLVVLGTPPSGATTQQSFSFKLVTEDTGGGDNGGGKNGSYDFVYPQSIGSYKAGTKVLGSDGEIYQCKPFPYSGWCTINAYQYVPGSGPNWQDAWIRL